MHAWLRLSAVVGLAFSGCTAGEPRGSPGPTSEQQLAQVQRERDRLRAALDDETARVVALQERLEEEARGREAARAETHALRERVERLEHSSGELVALLEQRAATPLAQPEVPASPLPPGLDAALRAFAGRHAGRVWYDAGRGALSFVSDRLFDPGGDAVVADAHGAFNELASIARGPLRDAWELIVVGHTDSSAITRPETLQKHPTNWHLSVHRAIAVKDLLVAAGLPEKRIGVMGFGPNRPIDEDRARNRRVEMYFVRPDEVRAYAPVREAR